MDGWLDDGSGQPARSFALQHYIALHRRKGVTLKERRLFAFLARWFLPRFLSWLVVATYLPN